MIGWRLGPGCGEGLVTSPHRGTFTDANAILSEEPKAAFRPYEPQKAFLDPKEPQKAFLDPKEPQKAFLDPKEPQKACLPTKEPQKAFRMDKWVYVPARTKARTRGTWELNT